MTNYSWLGKYREIVLAVACFLVFDLAVLVLNFYISYQISASAVSINLAGRERMLSQRMAKALMVADSNQRNGLPLDKPLDELDKTVSLFDVTLNAFDRGDTVTGSNNQLVVLKPVDSAQGREILQRAQTLWAPLKIAFDAVLAAGANVDAATLAHAVATAREHNVELLGVMNELTTRLELEANGRADTLRLVQTGGIVLALLNFLFILFKFLRRLDATDRKIEAAQKETAEILSTVKEGLFLLDNNFLIGSQYSASLHEMLGRRIQPGADFRLVLRELIAPSNFEAACDYIELLLAGRVKESLVAELNPLTEISVASDTGTARYLTLQFSRAWVNGKISHLLVTVFDVTVQVELEKALVEARKKAKADVEVMLDLLKVDSRQLRAFLINAEQTLLEINGYLRTAGGDGDYRLTINHIFRKMHALKGEAAAIGLQMFEELAHEFERLLVGLRGKGAVTGQDLIALPLPLDEFLSRISTVSDLAARLAAYNGNDNERRLDNALDDTPDNNLDKNNTAVDALPLDASLQALSKRIALAHGKRVSLVSDLALLENLPSDTRKEIYDITLQLLRNAIVHGIEVEHERLGRQKSPVGNIYLGIRAEAGGGYQLVLRDDGTGLDPQQIRETLCQTGRHTAAEVAAMSDRQVVMQIFEPGFPQLPPQISMQATASAWMWCGKKCGLSARNCESFRDVTVSRNSAFALMPMLTTQSAMRIRLQRG